MFDHVGLRVSDMSSSESFYRTVLGALGLEPGSNGEYVWWDEFIIGATDAEHPVATEHLHIGFAAWSREQVDGFHAAGVAAGYTSDGEPGERPGYMPGYYGAFLLDPDGNSIEAVHHDDVRRGGVIDHMWIGVRDLEQAAAFYKLIARHTGLREGASWDGAQQLRGPWSTFALVADGRPPTSGLHFAFKAPDRQTVEDFHAAAVAAGYTDNGGPGVRPRYSAGYFAAFVLDPDGNNVESVFHDRG
ncbi:MAG TPA: VOC family protein [Solirubrobacteraceae bacterium]|nr:VOC family protein [Solirubrobacteraceae bacterium]